MPKQLFTNEAITESIKSGAVVVLYDNYEAWELSSNEDDPTDFIDCSTERVFNW